LPANVHERTRSESFADVIATLHVDDSTCQPSATCIFCAVRTVFVDYQHSEHRVVPPDVLRNTLSAAFSGADRFQLNAMADADEVFNVILTQLHADQVVGFANASASSVSSSPSSLSAAASSSASSPAASPSASPSSSHTTDVGDGGDGGGRSFGGDAGDVACNPACISHQVGSITLVSLSIITSPCLCYQTLTFSFILSTFPYQVFAQQFCDLRRCTTCGATSEAEVTDSFVYRVYVSAARCHSAPCVTLRAHRVSNLTIDRLCVPGERVGSGKGAIICHAQWR
jgi:hypothetical protein